MNANYPESFSRPLAYLHCSALILESDYDEAKRLFGRGLKIPGLFRIAFVSLPRKLGMDGRWAFFIDLRLWRQKWLNVRVANHETGEPSPVRR